MNQSDMLRYAVAGTMALILLGSCVLVSVAAWLEGRREDGR